MEFRKHFDNSYILTEEGLNKIIDIGNDFLSTGKLKDNSIDISISYKGGISHSAISVNEARQFFNDKFSDVIEEVSFSVGNFLKGEKFYIRFDDYGITVNVESKDIARMTYYKEQLLN